MRKSQNAPKLRKPEKTDVSKPRAAAGSKPLVFTCSGAADVGEMTDRVARQLTRDGVAEMFCLAGIGGRVEWILEVTGEEEEILVLDGCAQSCARKTLEEAGFKVKHHVRMSDLGLKKRQTPVTRASVRKVADQVNQAVSGKPISPVRHKRKAEQK
jgi:uncharacterized metal-binding protein